MYNIKKFKIICSECGKENSIENTELNGKSALLCSECGEEILDVDLIRENVWNAILRVNPNDDSNWEEFEQNKESINTSELIFIGNVQGWNIYIDAYGKPWIFKNKDEEEYSNNWMSPIYMYIKGNLDYGIQIFEH